MSADQILFIFLAVLAALGAVGVVVLRNPVQAALSLVANFFVLAILYFTLGAQLLGITQIMVYLGAIMVLFLFVIMILRLGDKEQPTEKFDAKPAIGLLFGIGMFAMLFAGIVMGLPADASTVVHPEWGAPQMIGRILFTTYAWPFLIASVLLLVGIVGSILLAKRRLR